MHSFNMQPWATIAGAGGTTITQDESMWLDLAPFQDVVFYVDCREAINNPPLSFETSPTRDDSMFQSMGIVTLNGSATSTVLRALMLTQANVPLARYVRWKISGPAGAWDATFRVIISANAPGM